MHTQNPNLASSCPSHERGEAGGGKRKKGYIRLSSFFVSPPADGVPQRRHLCFWEPVEGGEGHHKYIRAEGANGPGRPLRTGSTDRPWWNRIQAHTNSCCVLVIIMRLYKLPLILGYKIIKFYNQISNFICTLSPPRLMASFYPHHPLLI